MLPPNPTYPRPTMADFEIAKLRARVAAIEAATYVMSESGPGSSFRLVLGFGSLADLQAAHAAVARASGNKEASRNDE